MSVNKRKREKVCMKTNDCERLVRKLEKHICHLVLNARDLPAFLAFDLTFVTGSSVGNATWLLLLRHSLAFTSIRRAGQRTSGLPLALCYHIEQLLLVGWFTVPATCSSISGKDVFRQLHMLPHWEVADHSISPSHSILTPGQPVPALALLRQAPGRVATGVLKCVAQPVEC